MKGKRKGLLWTAAILSIGGLAGCSGQAKDGKIEIELVHYKPEAVDLFEEMEEKFNSTHDDIHLTISSPNDAMTILKTRFVREDYPDILGIGGDINFSYFVDSEILADVSEYEGLSDIKESYLDILDGLEFVPTEGIYGVPYAANASGVLYNREMFKEHGWEIPETWDELIELSDVCQQVNAGETTFSKEYRETSEKMLKLLEYGEEGPFAYDYNSACTAFANGESAMYTIGSYAVPQVKSVNPDMDIDSFVMPGNEKAEGNTLNSGVDLMLAVTKKCENKEAAYEVISFLLEDENVQAYINDQNGVPCKKGEFTLAPNLDGMKQFIDEGNMTDYQDHYYPAEMAVDAQIQTFLIEQDVDAYLKKFDKDWARYNRDIIRKVEEYNEENQQKGE